MKKLNVGIIACSLMTLASHLYAAPPTPPALPKPPGSQIKSATIHLVQGENIFANGNMQAVVRVNYELKSGATLSAITLKEFGTGVSIESVGWTVSQTDNMYDHNISSNGRSLRNLRTSDTDNHSNQYETYYIATENSGKKIEICIELRTEKNEVTDVWSSCEDPSIQDGRIRLSALRPKKYTTDQFEIKREGVRTRDPSVAGLELIRVNPLGFSMKVIHVTTVPNDGAWMPAGLDFVGRYGLRYRNWYVAQTMFWNAQLYYVHPDVEHFATYLYGYNYWADNEETLIHLTTQLRPDGMTFINTWSSVYDVGGTGYTGWDLDPAHPRWFPGHYPPHGYPTGYGKVLAYDVYGNPIHFTISLNTDSLKYSISAW